MAERRRGLHSLKLHDEDSVVGRRRYNQESAVSPIPLEHSYWMHFPCATFCRELYYI